jgi:hypothetical protein
MSVLNSRKLLNKKASTKRLEIEKEMKRNREVKGSKAEFPTHFCPSESRKRLYRVAIEPLSHCDRAFAALR